MEAIRNFTLAVRAGAIPEPTPQRVALANAESALIASAITPSSITLSGAQDKYEATLSDHSEHTRND